MKAAKPRELGAGNVRGRIGSLAGIWLAQFVPAIEQHPIRVVQVARQFGGWNDGVKNGHA